jgi:hypothetical protein
MSTPSYQPPAEIVAMYGRQVVVDTDTSYIYVGLLEQVGAEYLSLSGVDVHDTSDSKSTKEAYAHETK